MTAMRKFGCLSLTLWAGSVALVSMSPLARADHDHGKAMDQNRAGHYRQMNLVSDLPGVAMFPGSLADCSKGRRMGL